MLLEALQFAVGAVRGAIFTYASAESPKDGVEWGNKIVWHTNLKEAEEVSAKTKKPVMVIIYHEHCPSCKIIIPRLTANEQIVELSRNFTVVALHDSKAVDGMKVDGGYIPRIYFMSPHGEILDKYYNAHGNPKFKYFYNNEETLATMMKQVMNDQGASAPPKKKK